MFELSVAAKYLTPRWRQLSVSIISIISILVIAVVVWLIVVFFSVTNGLTNSWIDKLIALTAPVRVTPTEYYYKSHYYNVDSISSKSGYSLKTIGEKLASAQSDPYDPQIDEEPPATWRSPDVDANGNLKDPVKEAFNAVYNIKGVSGLAATDYEMTVGNLRLRTLRKGSKQTPADTDQQGFISQASYLGSLDPENPALAKALLPLTNVDLTNVLSNLSVSLDNIQEDSPDAPEIAEKSIIQKRLKNFFAFIDIQALTTPQTGWKLPKSLYPHKTELGAVAIMRGSYVARLVIPQEKSQLKQLKSVLEGQGYKVELATIQFEGTEPKIKFSKGQEKPAVIKAPLYVEGGVTLPVRFDEDSIATVNDASQVLFNVSFNLQGNNILGKIPLQNLMIGKADIQKQFAQNPLQSPFWIYAVKNSGDASELRLPAIEGYGDGILLPKSFREMGAMLGDAGYLSYYTPTASTVQEQRIPVFVAGFYDPGIIPIGGKYILTNKEITTLIRASHNQEDRTLSNGINIRLSDRDKADQVKQALQTAFKQAGIDHYWKVETFREFDFTKDIIQQLQSEKRLFTLLATLIIIVACSNIISMLIILVNDKKLEIGILRSMGATSWSIAVIFGTCGVVMGVLGSLLGTIAAAVTLKNIQGIVDFISRVQGYEMFNPMFYGEKLPTDMSMETLTFVILATAVISLIAGIVPAVKASLLKPSAILKSE